MPTPGAAHLAPTQPPDPGPPPALLNVAAFLLVVRTGLNLVSLIFLPESVDRMMTVEPMSLLDPVDARTLKTVAVTIATTMSFVVGAGWLVVILLARKGRNWARIILTVGLAIDLFIIPATIASFVTGSLVLPQLVFTAPSHLLGLTSLVLLWLGPTGRWIAAKTALRKARRARVG